MEPGHASCPGGAGAGDQGATQRDERRIPEDPRPRSVFAQAIQARGIAVDEAALDALLALSKELAKIRGPAFYQETVVSDAQARDWVQRVEHALQFGEDLLRRLRKAL
jgi:hypothetical protein